MDLAKQVFCMYNLVGVAVGSCKCIASIGLATYLFLSFVLRQDGVQNFVIGWSTGWGKNSNATNLDASSRHISMRTSTHNYH
eukprot:scaffold34619_cov183-Amphora_coffeaeformis.AAC.3